jgi:hypothetical protein
MNRPKFHDIDGIGRTPAPSRPGRGLEALIPTSPRPERGISPAYDAGYDDGTAASATVRKVQWRQLEAALFSLTNAQFEYERGEVEDGRTHVEDCRRALGALALSLADAPDGEGYARLFEAITTEPKVRRR